MKALAAVALAGVLAGCAAGAPGPAVLDTRNEACTTCRMAISDAGFAAQVVAPSEVPRFFDDLGCLAAFLRAGRAPAQATVFVSDHRTHAWIRAEAAVYTRVDSLATPMGSHLVAHADSASREADDAARGGTAVSAAELFLPGSAAAGSAR